MVRSGVAAISRRRLGAAVVAAALVVPGACTSDPTSEPLPEPVEVETCEGLVDVGVVYVERMVLALDGLSVEVLTGEADPPADVAALADLARELDRRVVRLSCDVRSLNADIVAATSDLDAGDDPVLGLFLELVRGGVVGALPDVEPPTPTGTTGAGG